MRYKKLISAIHLNRLDQLTSILDSKDIEVEDSEKQQQNIKALKIAALMENWPAVLLLLQMITIELDDYSLKNLAKFKDQIISSKNLQLTSIDTSYLQSSLTKSTNLGRLAHYQRGFKSPTLKSGALGKIQLELTARLKSSRQTDPRLATIEQLSLLAEIDQLTRAPEAKQDANRFKKELHEWLKKPNTKEKKLIYLLLDTFLILSNKGHPALSTKRHKYIGTLIKTKLHFRSPKISISQEGVYRIKHGIHIGNTSSILPVFGHEVGHHVLQLMNNSLNPQPEAEWKNLVKLIRDDFKKAMKKSKLPKKYQVINYFDLYDSKEHVIELPSHLIEFLIENNSMPDDVNILSPETIAEIRRLLNLFFADLAEFKQKLETETDEKIKAPSKLELYNYFLNDDYKQFFGFFDPKHQRPVNLYPLHLVDLPSFQQFEKQGFSIFTADKFGTTPIESAFKARRFEVVVYLLEKYLSFRMLLPDSININQPDELGQTLLFHAIRLKKSREFIRQLIDEYKADVNIKDRYHHSVLYYAISEKLPVDTTTLIYEKVFERGGNTKQYFNKFLTTYENTVIGSPATGENYDYNKYADYDGSPEELVENSGLGRNLSI